MKPELEIAIEVAAEAHRGQVRKYTGEPYINHCLRVMQAVPDELKVAAVLHDVLEDTTVTVQSLIANGFDGQDIGRLIRLKRAPGQTYLHYIRGILHDPEVVPIKIADLEDNLSNCPPGSMRDKYELALYILEVKDAK